MKPLAASSALAILRTQGDQVAVAYVLAEARWLTEAAPLGRVKAQVLHESGQAQLQAGDVADAADAIALTLAVVRELGD